MRRIFVSLLVAAILLVIPASAAANVLESAPRYTTNSGVVHRVEVRSDFHYIWPYDLHNNLSANDEGQGLGGLSTFGTSAGAGLFPAPSGACYKGTDTSYVWVHVWKWTTCQGAGWYVSRGQISMSVAGKGRWNLADGTHQLGSGRTAIVRDNRQFMQIIHDNSACANC